MQIHTFIAESAPEAVAQIRSQLGPAAVVLNVRKLPASGLSRLWSSGKIEVLAGVPESLSVQCAEEIPLPTAAPLDAEPPAPDLSSPDRVAPWTSVLSAPRLKEKSGWNAEFLVRGGMLPLYAEQLLQQLIEEHGDAPRRLIDQGELAGRSLRASWPVLHRSESNTHIFVGPPGSGKSTVLCKLAARSILLETQPARILQLDTHSANSSELPALYAEILGASFERSLPSEPQPGADLTLIDLPGTLVRSGRALQSLQQIKTAFPDAAVHLVLNAAYESQLLIEQARFFAPLQPADLILTHLDEETRWGKLWNLTFATRLGIRYLSAGQNIPGELLNASPETILARQFGGK